MSKRFVLGLAAVVVALIGYIVVFERGSLSTKELEARKGRVLSTFVRDHVTQLGLTRDGKAFVLARKLEDDGTFTPWKLTAPIAAEADQDSIDRMLGEIEWASARRILEHVPSADLEKLGLSKPRLRLDYKVSGDDYSFLVGGPDAQGDNFYTAYAGEDTVYVVPKTLVEALDHELGHFRSKEFLGNITSAWVDRVILAKGADKATLQKQDGTWWVTNEPKSYADERHVKELIAKLDGLRAVRFLEGPERQAAEMSLRGEVRSVELRVMPDTHREDKQAERFLLRLGSACVGHDGERYAQAGERGDPVCVRAEDVERFDAGSEELRLTRLFGADPSEVEAIEIEAADAHWTLKRDGEKWAAQGGLAAADRDAVEAWLRDLSETRALGVVPQRPLTASLTLRLSLAGETKLVLKADPGDGKELLVQREGEPVSVRFPAALWERLRPLSVRFSSLALWPDKQPSQVLELSARDESRARKLVLVDGVFRERKGAPAVKDAEHARELVRALIKLSALSVVSDRTRPEQGIEGSRAGITMTLGEGTPLTLELGAKSERGVFARVDGKRVVELDPAVQGLVRELASGERVEPELGADAGVGDVHENEEGHEDGHEHEHE